MVYTIVVHLYAKDSAESISKLHNKLLEASDVYCNDSETINWFVMQDHQDKRSFTIVERFEHESVRHLLFLSLMLTAVFKLASMADAIVLMQCRMQSQKYHLEVRQGLAVMINEVSIKKGPSLY